MKAYDSGSANLMEAYLCLLQVYIDNEVRRKDAVEQIYKLGFNDGRTAVRKHGPGASTDTLLAEDGGGRTFLDSITTTQTKEEETCNG